MRIGAALAATLALGAVGCGQAKTQTAHVGGTTATTSGTAIVASLPSQEARLALPAGRATRQYAIAAPSPAQYAFNVTLEMPTTASLALSIRTYYGAVFSLFDTREHREHCTVRGARLECALRYPVLPAQKAGRWSVVALKRSTSPVTVHVAVTFYRPTSSGA
jgi:hypothetical protein